MRKLKRNLILGISVGLMLSMVLNITINVLSIAPPTSKYTITCTGYVKDRDTGAGISGATVRLSEPETGISITFTTSSSGYYSVSISTFSFISYTLKVERSGYISQTKTYYSPGSYSYTFNLYSQIYTIMCNGYVLNINTGSPVVDGLITIKELGTGLSKTVLTNSIGYYTLYFQTTSYTAYELKFTKSGYVTLTKSYNAPGTYSYNFNVNAIYSFSCSGYVHNDDTSIGLEDAYVKLYDSNNVLLASEPTNFNGYYTIQGTTYASENFHLEISKLCYQTQTLNYIAGTYNDINVFLMPIDYNAQKLGFFFYNSEVNFNDCVQYYDGVIRVEGFTTTLYENENDWQSIMEDIDILEGESDYIFIYLLGHGQVDNGHSAVNTGSNNWIVSDDFATYIDKLESNNIFIVVEACNSGGFVTDLQGPNRFVISSCRIDQLAIVPKFYGLTLTPLFSTYFFSYIFSFQSDIQAFTNAYVLTVLESSILTLGALVQEPQYNDQLPETWFLLWPFV